MGWAESPSEAVGRAADIANKALALDEPNVRAHIILGCIRSFISVRARPVSRLTERSRSIPTRLMRWRAATYECGWAKPMRRSGI